MFSEIRTGPGKESDGALTAVKGWEQIRNPESDIYKVNPVINAEADYITFDGLTINGTRSDGVIITGENNTVRNCLIKNVAGNALVMYGSNNLAYNNEITRTGKGNLIFNIYKEIGDIYDSAYRFGDISHNEIYSLNKIDDIFKDADSGNYEIRDIEKLRKKFPILRISPLIKSEE